MSNLDTESVTSILTESAIIYITATKSYRQYYFPTLPDIALMEFNN